MTGKVRQAPRKYLNGWYKTGKNPDVDPDPSDPWPLKIYFPSRRLPSFNSHRVSVSDLMGIKYQDVTNGVFYLYEKAWEIKTNAEKYYEDNYINGSKSYEWDDIDSQGKYYTNYTDKGKVYKKLAYDLFGRAFHLLGDMGVPAHTHNDPHPSDPKATKSIFQPFVPGGDDSYEAWFQYEDVHKKYSWMTGKVYNQEIFNRYGSYNLLHPYPHRGKVDFSSYSDTVPAKIMDSNPVFYIFYVVNQVADWFASDDKDGDGTLRIASGLLNDLYVLFRSRYSYFSPFYEDGLFGGNMQNQLRLNNNDSYTGWLKYVTFGAAMLFSDNNDRDGDLSRISDNCFNTALKGSAGLFKYWYEYWKYVRIGKLNKDIVKWSIKSNEAAQNLKTIISDLDLSASEYSQNVNVNFSWIQKRLYKIDRRFVFHKSRYNTETKILDYDVPSNHVITSYQPLESTLAGGGWHIKPGYPQFRNCTSTHLELYVMFDMSWGEQLTGHSGNYRGYVNIQNYEKVHDDPDSMRNQSITFSIPTQIGGENIIVRNVDTFLTVTSSVNVLPAQYYPNPNANYNPDTRKVSVNIQFDLHAAQQENNRANLHTFTGWTDFEANYNGYFTYTYWKQSDLTGLEQKLNDLVNWQSKLFVSLSNIGVISDKLELYKDYHNGKKQYLFTKSDKYNYQR